MVMYTGGFAPQTHATELMSFLAIGHVLGLSRWRSWCGPASLAMVFLLHRTLFGRYVYAIGNREAAAYLSGVRPGSCWWRPSRCAACAPGWPACCSPAIRPRPTRAWATPTCCRRSPPWSSAAPYPGRQGPLRRHRGRHHPDHPALVGALGHADARGRPPDHLRQVIIVMLLAYGRSRPAGG